LFTKAVEEGCSMLSQVVVLQGKVGHLEEANPEMVIPGGCIPL
jgi:hypothetical protein